MYEVTDDTYLTVAKFADVINAARLADKWAERNDREYHIFSNDGRYVGSFPRK